MSAAVIFERVGAIVTLTLNKPETRNPTTDPDILGGLNDACDRIAADAGIGCVILTGAGKTFSAGGNLKHMRDREGNLLPRCRARVITRAIMRKPFAPSSSVQSASTCR